MSNVFFGMLQIRKHIISGYHFKLNCALFYGNIGWSTMNDISGIERLPRLWRLASQRSAPPAEAWLKPVAS